MNQFKHLTLATDMSQANSEALVTAKMFQNVFKCQLSVVMAIPVPSFYSFRTLEYDEIEKELISEYKIHFETFIKENGFSKESSHLIVGDVSDVIYTFVQNNNVDLVILGSHGEYGIRNEIGSTIMKLLMRLNCNIYIANSR